MYRCKIEEKIYHSENQLTKNFFWWHNFIIVFEKDLFKRNIFSHNYFNIFFLKFTTKSWIHIEIESQFWIHIKNLMYLDPKHCQELTYRNDSLNVLINENSVK